MFVKRRIDSVLRGTCFVLFALLLIRVLYSLVHGPDDTIERMMAESTKAFEDSYKKREEGVKAIFYERRQMIEEICDDDVTGSYEVSWKSFNERRLIVSDGRSKSQSNWWDRIFVVPNANVTFCSIPQVDSVDWVRHLSHLGMYLTTVPEPQSIRPPALLSDYNWLNFSSSMIVPLASFEQEEARKILESYKKVVWVRDPLERLLLAWQNKLQSWEYFSKDRVEELIRAQQPGVTNEEIDKLMPISLQSFFNYLVKEPTGFSFDVNWRSYRDLCAVCQLSYDFVLYRETDENKEALPYEVEYIFRQALNGRNDLPSFQVTMPQLLNMSQLEEIEPLLVHRVLDVYKLDYALFGFQRPKQYQ